MTVTYTSGELQMSGTVTNAQFYAATATAGLEKSDGLYKLLANVRIMADADLSGLSNILISLNTQDFFFEAPSSEFKKITFIESGGRSVADRAVFRLSASGDYPVLTECQFIHNIAGNPGGGDPRYISVVNMSGASNTTFRASEFSEQEVGGVAISASGIYDGLAGTRVTRFFVIGEGVRVILTNVTQSSTLYDSGGVAGAYGGASLVISNWDKEILNPSGNTTWFDDYDGQVNDHWLYLLGTAASQYRANGAGISNKKNQLHVVLGGHKYYNFINGEGGKFAYFDSRSSSPQKCILTTSGAADMLETATVTDIDATENIEFITATKLYNRDTGSWQETGINNQLARVRNYGFNELNLTFDNVTAVEGSPESYAPSIMTVDAGITETDKSVVEAYTGIAITWENITLSSGTWTPEKIYDYCKSWLVDNMSVANFVTVSGSGYIYDYRINVDGTAILDIDPAVSTINFSSEAPVYELYIRTGTVNIGSESISGGLTTYSSGTALKFARQGTSWSQTQSNIRINGTGTLNHLGGDVYLRSPIYLTFDSNWIARSGNYYNDRTNSDRLFVRSWATSGVDVTGVSFYDFAIGSFRSPDTFKNVKLIRSYFSAVGSNSGTNTPFVLRDFEALGNTDFDFMNEGSSVVSIINAEVGTELLHAVSDQDPDASIFVNTGGSKLYKELQLKITDTSRVGLESQVYITDTDNGSRRSITSYAGTLEDFTDDQVYSFTTDTNGDSTVQQILTGVFYFVEDATPEDTVDQRGNYNDNSDLFTVNAWVYGKQPIVTEVVLKGKSIANAELMAINDLNTSQPDKAITAAYTGISIDHPNKMITVSESHSLAEIYDYISYDKSTAGGVAYPTPSTKVAGVVGSRIDLGDYNLTIDGIDLSSGDSGFSLLQTTGEIAFTLGATIDFNFLDSKGDALLVIDTPLNWTLEGIYPSQADALAQTGKLSSSTNYKYMHATDGASEVWFRVEDDDGSGVAFDSYVLPATRGIHETAAVTTTDDSLLNQIRSLVRDVQTEQGNQYTTALATEDKKTTDYTAARPKILSLTNCPTEEMNTQYKLVPVHTVDWYNSLTVRDDVTVGDDTIIQRDQVYVSSSGEYVIAVVADNEFAYTIFALQGTSEYYKGLASFYPFIPEYGGDVSDGREWYAMSGKYPGSIASGTLAEGMCLLSPATHALQSVVKVREKTDNLVFTDPSRVDATVPDQLTETEYDEKSAIVSPTKGWR
ncbi:hypothetical protein NVP1031O_152 [Vibrio phage 1.031.O._10N.261.46.F8]|nr:hypothetical protein NVP1031O_152 [Vibrio phage 1.031.O._10N.261.46.F8]